MRFTESQHFSNWLRYGILLIAIVILFIIVRSSDFNNLEMIPIAIAIFIPSLFILWTQVTEIDSSSIHIKVRPFINKQIPFTEIESWTVRTYKPLAEYGGWGVRFGMNGTAYNVGGNKGLQLRLTGGRMILIGTQKATELIRIMKSICPEKEI